MKQSNEMAEIVEDSSTDYWFLRDNGIHSKTTLRMLAKAYQGKKGLGGETE